MKKLAAILLLLLMGSTLAFSQAAQKADPNGGNVVYIGVISIIVYKAIDAVIGNRVSAAAEVEGLDIPEMGIPGYVGIAEDVEAEHAALARIAGRPVPVEGR